MTQPVRPFKPQATGGTVLAVSNGSSNVAIPGSPPTQVRLRTKPTDADCFIEFGTSSTTAVATTGYAFAGGAVEFLSVPLNATHIAAITESGTATLYIHSGEGT